MKYNCEICKYQTNDASNWRKHKFSKRHLKKVNQSTNQKSDIANYCRNIAVTLPGDDSIKRYTCDYCSFTTSHYASHFKHNKRCMIRKHKEIVGEKDNEIKDLTINHLKQVIEMLRETLGSSDNSTSKNGCSFREIIYTELKDNPPLKSLDYSDFLKIIKPKKNLQRRYFLTLNTIHYTNF